jgi:HTH-type transcriptional regulator / antitoxin HigA
VTKAEQEPTEEKEVNTMAVKTAPWPPPDSYFKLVKQFPLTHLRDDEHLDAAQRMLDRLLQEDLDEGAQQYLDVLTDLIEDYEEKHVPMPDASEADVLRELMRNNGLSQPKLAKAAGIAQSTLSAVLNGTRSLTKEQLIKLAKFFNVSPAAFLPT